MKSEEYTSEDFEGLMFNVFEASKKEEILDQFPKLKKLKEFNIKLVKPLLNKVIRFVVYCYDRNSPLILDYPNINKRKVESCKVAGFTYDDNNKFDKEVIKMLKGENPKVNKMVVKYCLMQRPTTYALIVSGSNAYTEILNELENNKKIKDLDPLDAAKKKADIFKKAGEMQASIDKSIDELLVYDKNQKLEDELFDAIDENDVEIFLTPEDVNEEYD